MEVFKISGDRSAGELRQRRIDEFVRQVTTTIFGTLDVSGRDVITKVDVVFQGTWP